MAYGNGFHRALLFGFANAFSNGVAIIYGGQTSMQAGGERAGQRVYLKEADIEPLKQLGLIKYAESRDLRDVAAHLRQPGDVGRGARRGARVRPDADRDAGRRAVYQRRGRRAEAPRGVSGNRSGAEPVRQQSRRRARRYGSAACRSRSSACWPTRPNCRATSGPTSAASSFRTRSPSSSSTRTISTPSCCRRSTRSSTRRRSAQVRGDAGRAAPLRCARRARARHQRQRRNPADLSAGWRRD